MEPLLWRRFIALGLCATSPALLVDERPMGRMTPQKFDALVKELAS